MIFADIVKTEPICKGWSCDKKYRATISNGTAYLLRIPPSDKSEMRGALLFQAGTAPGVFQFCEKREINGK